MQGCEYVFQPMLWLPCDGASCALQDHAEVRAVIPRRSSLLGDRGVLIVNYAMHKQKTLFFFLLQVRLLGASCGSIAC